MKIVVCVKQVPETKDVKIDPVTNNLAREGIPSIVNPHDENAIEQALRIREEVGGSVTCISMGPPQAAQVLQHALDMGADRAVLLADRTLAGADTLATGYALAKMIKAENADLVLCGAEAIDGCTGQVGPIIAEKLGCAQVTNACEVTVKGKTVQARREIKEGYELLEGRAQMVVCLLKGCNTPRKPIRSEKVPVTLSATDAGLDTARTGLNGSPTRVVNITMSERRQSSFVVVDSSLPVKERIKAVVNGGIAPKKISLTRGTPEHLAEVILKDEIFSGHLSN